MKHVLPSLICVVLSCSLCRAQNSSTFTYQGELRDGGSPATGSFDMDFTIWNAASGGSRIGSIIEINDVTVERGRFSVELDFGPTVFNNDPRWLEIEVQGHTLVPRQPVNRSPYSIQTRGIYVDNELDVGIGTTAPEAPLHVHAGSAGAVTPHFRSSAVFERAGTNYVSILSPDNAERGLLFGDPESYVNGAIMYNASGTRDGFQFRTGDNITRMRIDSVGDVHALRRLGVGGPSSLFGQFTVVQDNSESVFAIEAQSEESLFPTIYASNIGGGPAIWALSSDDASLSGGGAIIAGDEAGQNLAIDRNEIMARNNGQPSTLYLNVDGGDIDMGFYRMHPAHAYGRVDSNGTLISGSANISSVTRVADGKYVVSVAGGLSSADVVLVTVGWQFPQFAVARVVSGSAEVGIYTVNADRYNTPFSFVIYRP